METFKRSLDTVEIASPCTVPWDSMKGSDRSRFCGQCKLNVYNIAEMTRAEARTLIEKSEGRLCLRLYRRPDRTVMTSDCSVIARVRQKFLPRLVKVMVLVGFTALVSTGTACRDGRVSSREFPSPLRKIAAVLMGEEPQFVGGAIMDRDYRDEATDR